MSLPHMHMIYPQAKAIITLEVAPGNGISRHRQVTSTYDYIMETCQFGLQYNTSKFLLI